MDHRTLYLTRDEVSSIGPSMPEVIELLRQMFLEKAAGRIEMPPKTGIHTRDDALLHAMPAYVPGLRCAGVKWVGAYPGNPERDLPQVTGLIVTNDPDTGLPVSVLDCTWITAVRTAGASALAAKYLARKDSKTLGILGCGVQGRSHLEAFTHAFPIAEVRVYDVNPAAVASFAEASAELEASVIRVESPRAAVEGCDIVVTAGPITKPPHATIPRDWLSGGGFAASVDFGSYWSLEAMEQLDTLITDDVEQFAYYNALGYINYLPEGVVDLSELVSGKHPGRRSDEERTMACHLGIAAEDIAVASVVVDRAKAAGIGTWLPL
jgi:ornithine cyclodeaminase/alanine dehydrogenase-like protein (mu-crystallin family)